MTNFHWDGAKKIEKKIIMADSKKLRFSKPPILKKKFQKFHGLVFGLVGLIDTKGMDPAGSTFIAVRLSDISTKTGKKCIVFLGHF